MAADRPDPVSLARANEPFVKRLAQRMTDDEDLMRRLADDDPRPTENEQEPRS